MLKRNLWYSLGTCGVEEIIIVIQMILEKRMAFSVIAPLDLLVLGAISQPELPGCRGSGQGDRCEKKPK